jgi:hypothetical protein
VAVSLFWISIVATVAFALNPRFVDRAGLGVTFYLVLPVLGGGVLGLVLGRILRWLAGIGSSEDVPRAYELLWASVAGIAVFAATLPFLPPLLSLFHSSEMLRYGVGPLIAMGLGWLASITARYVCAHRRIWVWPLLAALPVVAILAGATPSGRGLAPGSRALILAFPGMSWTVAEELIERGEMPNLEVLRRGGAWGDVHSVQPYTTSAVWTSVATGRPAREHGILGVAASTTQDVQTRRIWDIFAERAWSVGIFGWPVTWPPTATDGFVVPSVSDPGPDTWPPRLGFIRELAMNEKTRRRRTWGRYCRYAFLGIRYGVRLGTLSEAAGEILSDPLHGRTLNSAQIFTKRKLRAKLNSDFFVELRRKFEPDFAAYHTNIIHVAQSHFWKYHEPDSFGDVSREDIERYGGSVHDAYRLADAFIGKILADAAEDELVVVVSDHGAEAVPGDSHRNLTLRPEPLLREMRLKNAVEATNLGLRTYVRMRDGHEPDLDGVRRLFQTARLARADIQPFVTRLDEWGNMVVTIHPDVVPGSEDVVLFQGGRCPLDDLVRSMEFQESSRTVETGALVLSGRRVAPGTHFENADLLDLMPTMLALNEMDLAADLAGDVIQESLEEALRHRIPGVVATYEPATP